MTSVVSVPTLQSDGINGGEEKKNLKTSVIIGVALNSYVLLLPNAKKSGTQAVKLV